MLYPDSKYSSISFPDGNTLNFIPNGWEQFVGAGETYVIPNSVFFYQPIDGFKDTYQCYNGLDYTGNRWNFDEWGPAGPWYNLGKLDQATGLDGESACIAFIAAGKDGKGVDKYHTACYGSSYSDEYGIFVDGVSSKDGVTTMAQAISNDPERRYYGVLNVSKLSEGKFADFIRYTPSGGVNAWGGSFVGNEDMESYFSNGGLNETPGPYEPGGTSGPGGGDGTFDGSSVDIDIPDAPSLSATATGFISLFNPTLPQLNDLAEFMWSDLFDIDTFKKLFADPMQSILGLSIIPGPIPSSGAVEVKVGNIGTGVSMNRASQQYITIDCGSLDVQEYWGAYLDYDPYTKCEIYLPYIGTHAIAADDIMGKTVRVVYRVDILSGACIAYIKCGGSVLYQFAGQCAASIPITGNDWTNVINGTLSVAASIGSLVATGGASAPLAASALANTAVNQMKPSVEKSGSLSGAAGIMGIQQPYLIVTRPRQALPYKQNTYTGYPSLYSVNLSELTGYTEIEKIHLEGIPATEKELAEIDTLLKGGVIF